MTSDPWSSIMNIHRCLFALTLAILALAGCAVIPTNTAKPNEIIWTSYPHATLLALQGADICVSNTGQFAGYLARRMNEVRGHVRVCGSTPSSTTNEQTLDAMSISCSPDIAVLAITELPPPAESTDQRIKNYALAQIGIGIRKKTNFQVLVYDCRAKAPLPALNGSAEFSANFFTSTLDVVTAGAGQALGMSLADLIGPYVPPKVAESASAMAETPPASVPSSAATPTAAAPAVAASAPARKAQPAKKPAKQAVKPPQANASSPAATAAKGPSSGASAPKK